MLPTPCWSRPRTLSAALVLSLMSAPPAWAQMAPEPGAFLSLSRDHGLESLGDTIAVGDGASIVSVAARGDDTAASTVPSAAPGSGEIAARAVSADASSGDEGAVWSRASYAGRDGQGVPRYLERPFTDEERQLLRRQFGIEDPRRLYLSDTLAAATLTYDTRRDGGDRDLVSSYRVGAASVRRPGETWEELERRLAATTPASFPRTARRADRALTSLNPEVRPHAVRLLAAARRAGFRVRVVETRRSAERQAYLLTLDGHLTHTATSRHAEGFALDVVVDDGDLARASTRRHWTAFRRWVVASEHGVFRLIGAADRSWDWPHLEYVAGPPGFGSIEALLEAARRCDMAGLPDCTEEWRSGHGPVTVASGSEDADMRIRPPLSP